MKKMCVAIIMMFVFAGGLLCFHDEASAAGTVTVSRTTKGSQSLGTYIELYTFSWTADSSDGSVPDTETDLELHGYVVLGVTDPGGTAPTDNYDIDLNDEYGVDVFGGELNNRDTSNTEQAIPKIGTSFYGLRRVDGKLTFSLSGNSVNSATGVLYLYVIR